MNSKESLIESLKQQGFSKKIVDAFSKVPREVFIPEEVKEYAYEDSALPIGKGQTISQPYTIAMMLSLLELDKLNLKSRKNPPKILEVGSGCGYVLALMSEILGTRKKDALIFGIEIIKELAEKSRENIQNAGNYKNIKIFNKNGFYGLKEEASFDRILISAACIKIPEALIEQLKEGGILVAPVGGRYEQSLKVFKKRNGKLELKSDIAGFIFVPFIEESEEH